MDVEITTPNCDSIKEPKNTRILEKNSRSPSNTISMKNFGSSFRFSKPTIVFHFENTLASVVESLPSSLNKSYFDHNFKVKVKPTLG
jgi:hypothetical protein